MTSPSRRRTEAQSAWNVPAVRRCAPSPISAASLFRISRAARFVNVTAAMRQGLMPTCWLR